MIHYNKLIFIYEQFKVVSLFGGDDEAEEPRGNACEQEENINPDCWNSKVAMQ